MRRHYFYDQSLQWIIEFPCPTEDFSRNSFIFYQATVSIQLLRDLPIPTPLAKYNHHCFHSELEFSILCKFSLPPSLPIATLRKLLQT
jgi:hypothetical protein